MFRALDGVASAVVFAAEKGCGASAVQATAALCCTVWLTTLAMTYLAVYLFFSCFFSLFLFVCRLPFFFFFFFFFLYFPLHFLFFSCFLSPFFKVSFFSVAPCQLRLHCHCCNWPFPTIIAIGPDGGRSTPRRPPSLHPSLASLASITSPHSSPSLLSSFPILPPSPPLLSPPLPLSPSHLLAPSHFPHPPSIHPSISTPPPANSLLEHLAGAPFLVASHLYRRHRRPRLQPPITPAHGSIRAGPAATHRHPSRRRRRRPIVAANPSPPNPTTEGPRHHGPSGPASRPPAGLRPGTVAQRLSYRHGRVCLLWCVLPGRSTVDPLRGRRRVALRAPPAWQPRRRWWPALRPAPAVPLRQFLPQTAGFPRFPRPPRSYPPPGLTRGNRMVPPAWQQHSPSRPSSTITTTTATPTNPTNPTDTPNTQSSDTTGSSSSSSSTAVIALVRRLRGRPTAGLHRRQRNRKHLQHLRPRLTLYPTHPRPP